MRTNCVAIFHPNPKNNPDVSGQKSKLRNLFILSLVFCVLTFLPLPSESAYKIYLKNGRIMTGVDLVKEEAGRVKIYRNGIMLELPKTGVIKIEEYHKIETITEEPLEEKAPEEGKTPVENQLPEYLRYKEHLEVEAPEEPSEKAPKEETKETPEKKLKTTGVGEFKEGELKPDAQLKELRRLEEEGKLPEQFKSYKDFLEKRYEQQKNK